MSKMIDKDELIADLFKGLVIQLMSDSCHSLDESLPGNLHCCGCSDARDALNRAQKLDTAEMRAAISAVARMGARLPRKLTVGRLYDKA